MILFEAETLEERERHFREAVMARNHDIEMDESVLEDFLDIWTQDTVYKGKTMMLFEKRKITSAFKISNRMAYWKRNNPVKVSAGEKFLDYYNLNYENKLVDPQKKMKYRQHLVRLGWKFGYSGTGGQIVTPPKL